MNCTQINANLPYTQQQAVIFFIYLATPQPKGGLLVIKCLVFKCLSLTRTEHQLIIWMADFYKGQGSRSFITALFPPLLPFFPSFLTAQMRGRIWGTSSVCT